MTQYPLPHIEEIYARLAGGRIYSKLDLPEKYWQVELNDDSKRHVVITTQKGLYRYNRLYFCIASAPAIIQGIIEQILRPVPNGKLYLNDIVAKRVNEQDHLSALRATFQALRHSGIRLKRKKCLFAKPEIKYLGHGFNGSGLSPDPEKVKAIVDAPRPTKLEQLEISRTSPVLRSTHSQPQFSSRATERTPQE